MTATRCALVGLSAALLAGCTATTPGHPMRQLAQPSSQTISPTAAADRDVCIDLDARGGALYTVLVVPMMAGKQGRKSIDVNAAQMGRAVQSLTSLQRGRIDRAGPEVADEARRLVAAVDAFGVYQHADSTALLTAFVGLAAACQKAGYKPSWFDATGLVAH